MYFVRFKMGGKRKSGASDGASKAARTSGPKEPGLPSVKAEEMESAHLKLFMAWLRLALMVRGPRML